MTDLILESLRAIVLIYLIIILIKVGRTRFLTPSPGWNWVIAEIGLLLFGSLIDITDNFESLNKFIIVGDTEVQAFLEKFVGYLGGFVTLAVGLVPWIPKEFDELGAARAEAIESEERFSKVYQSSPALVSISTVDDATIMDVNKAWLDTLGYERDEAIGHTPFELNMLVDPGIRIRAERNLDQPLTAISAYVDGTLKRLRARKSESSDIMDALDKASEQAHRAGSIIRRLRNFVANTDQNFKDLDINDTVRAEANMTAGEFKNSQIKLPRELGEIDRSIFGDEILIQQVILNLARNGLEAMTESKNKNPASASAFHLPFNHRASRGRIWADNGDKSGVILSVCLPTIARAARRDQSGQFDLAVSAE